MSMWPSIRELDCHRGPGDYAQPADIREARRDPLCRCEYAGAVPRTSTLALTNVTIAYALELAGKGVTRALYGNGPLKHGVNTYRGHVTHSAVAEAVGLPYTGLDTLLPIS